MKSISKIIVVWVALAVAIFCCMGASGGKERSAYGSVQGQTAVLYLPGADPEHSYMGQIGSTQVEIKNMVALSELETPLETVVLLNNTSSIPEAQRKTIKEVLEDLIANRMQGEAYTFVTFSGQATYLCDGETNYSTLKNAIGQLEYKEANTKFSAELYPVLEKLRDSDEGRLRRIVIISDGMDYQQTEYTREEMNRLIQSLGYPIYTVDCVHSAQSSTEQLQNLFALSRSTGGSSFRLQEVTESMNVVSEITSWNDSVRMELELPSELCDGSQQMLRVYSPQDGSSYVLSITMPFADVANQAPAANVSAGATQPGSQGSSTQTILLIVGIAGGAVLVGGAVVAGIVVVGKKKKAKAFEKLPFDPSPQSPEGGPASPAGNLEQTVMVQGQDTALTEETAMMWGEDGKHRLVLSDPADPSRRYEAPLQGSVMIGRDPSCQIVFGSDRSVARQQCEIYEKNGKVMLRNLSRSNLTRVNGQTISGEVELADHSTLKMGLLTLQVEIL